MLKYIINQWKFRPFTISLIICGFFVASVVLSLGISISMENYKYINDMNSGDVEKQLIINVNFKNEKKAAISMVEEYSKYGEIQVISSMGKVFLDEHNEEFQIIPVMFKKESDWHIPIINGRYFNKGDVGNDIKEIIIGKDVAKKLGVNINELLKINGEQYKIIGVSGRVNRETQWDDIIYVVWNDYKNKIADLIGEEVYMTLLLKEGKINFINDSKGLIDNAESKNIELTFEELKQNATFDSFTNSILITTLLSGSIFIIAIINIINLMIYWVIERSKEFGIMKALGATSGYIIKWILIEVILMILIGAFVATLTHGGAQILFKDLLIQNDIYFSITWINLLVSIIIAGIFGMISAIIPCYTAIKINLIELINKE